MMTRLVEKFTQDPENVWKLFNHMNDGLMITDFHRNIIVTNPAFEKITGYTFEEVHNKNPKFLQSGKTEGKIYKSMWKALDEQGAWTGELINKRKNGEEFYSFLSITYIKKENKQDSYFIGLMRDITAKKKAEKRIEFLAYHDTLTRLPNRAKFMKCLEETFDEAQKNNNPFAILFLDLDRFKIVNDSLGHQAGDQLLIEVAKRLTRVVGEKGIVSRLGGDEFTIILNHIRKKEDVHQLIDEIFVSFQHPYQFNGENIMITASIGVSFYPDHGSDIHTILCNADSAMYRTKEEGKNNFFVYNDKVPVHSKERLFFEQELHQAIERKQLEVYYQLQVDVQTGLPSGAEALVRWNHPEKGLLSPGKFLSIAEESGFIVDIDDWVMNTALRQAKQWHEMGHESLIISVNVSKKLFDQQSFVNKVKRLVNTIGINPKLVCLEISEKMVIENVNEAVNKINEIKSLGIQVSLDDFGTGYSSLSQLKNIPIDTLKIDQSFVRQTDDAEKNSAIVKLIIAMAKTLNFIVTCEGVETQEQLTLIRNEGCHHAQGFLFSKPMPKKKSQALLQQMKLAVS